ncbi:MAG TPA: NAD(P)H-dependent oxidoreductase subunit E [Thermodesulfobacteriota bacterium]|nr:NAD(P)H-dependent oxidoreductase subunit E [Thermodesulfobacteriota bacterium]
MKELEEILKPFKGKSSETIPALQAVQEKLGYLPKEAIEGVAQTLRLSAGEVYAVVTFYAQFRLKPIGENIITVCRGTACHVGGSLGILKELEKTLGIYSGETDKKREFTLQTVACFGACARAPITVTEKLGLPGRKVHGYMTKTKAKDLVDEIKEKIAEEAAEKGKI